MLYVVLFSAILVGYVIGRINFFGFQLGSSGILVTGLVLGHMGYTMPAIVRDFGLINFVTSVGLLAGPVMFKHFKSNALPFIIIGALIAASGGLICAAVIGAGIIPAPLAAGIMTGALTSTPGLATALEAFSDPSVSVGYGIAYPFGVIGVVLFVQIMPKLRKYTPNIQKTDTCTAPACDKKSGLIELDPYGLGAFAATVILGAFLGHIDIPVPGSTSFTLGLSGGPLLAGLIIGHFGRVGPLSLKVSKSTIDVLREYGLLLFLLSAGMGAGGGFVAIVAQYGVKLFVVGALMTLIPMILGYICAVYLAKLDFIVSLGAICGGMTSTPALGTLISMVKQKSMASQDQVAASYAATYPVALILIVFIMRALFTMFS